MAKLTPEHRAEFVARLRHDWPELNPSVLPEVWPIAIEAQAMPSRQHALKAQLEGRMVELARLQAELARDQREALERLDRPPA
jgi:hypothetical protein